MKIYYTPRQLTGGEKVFFEEMAGKVWLSPANGGDNLQLIENLPNYSAGSEIFIRIIGHGNKAREALAQYIAR